MASSLPTLYYRPPSISNEPSGNPINPSSGPKVSLVPQEASAKRLQRTIDSSPNRLDDADMGGAAAEAAGNAGMSRLDL
jgi:hypothetical protein